MGIRMSGAFSVEGSTFTHYLKLLFPKEKGFDVVVDDMVTRDDNAKFNQVEDAYLENHATWHIRYAIYCNGSLIVDIYLTSETVNRREAILYYYIAHVDFRTIGQDGFGTKLIHIIDNHGSSRIVKLFDESNFIDGISIWERIFRKFKKLRLVDLRHYHSY